MTSFTDLFSQDAGTYAAARPDYPDELFAWLAALVPGRELAWDCATGNGQAAVGLARHFGRVIATDASAEQIANARSAPNVKYHVATAESSALPPASVSCVTVAQALHWLDPDAFYAEVRRVTVPHGILAAWSYGSCSAGKDVDPLLRELEFDTLAPWWHPARRFVDEAYRTIPFPFPEIPAPACQLRVRWNLHQLRLYLGSWSAVVAFRRARGEDPVADVIQRIADRWGAADTVRDVTWPLALRVGRIA